MNSNENLFLNTRNKVLWSDMTNSINTYEEMVIISPFINGKQLDELKNIIKNWDKNKKFSLKILTTTYDGLMRYLDLEGLKNFVSFIEENYPNINVEIKVEDARQENVTRLHAKAYLFRNKKQSEVIYTGSANFTYTGMNTGEEWNIKLNKCKEPGICKDIDNNFNSLWNREINYSNNQIWDVLLSYKKSFQEVQNEIQKIEREKTNSIIKTYEAPEKFIKRNIYQRNKNKNILENKPERISKNLFLQFAILNNKYLINNFIEIINSKKLSEDEIVNNLLIASFVDGELNLRTAKNLKLFLEENNYKNLEEILFDEKYSKLLDWIKDFLQEKLKNDNNLINNKNLRHTFLTYQQCKALALHANYLDFENWNLSRSSGVELSTTPNSKIALFTAEDNDKYQKSKYYYQDHYYREMDEFKWFAPNRWKKGKYNKISQLIVNNEKEAKIFHKTQDLELLFKKNESKIYYEYLGNVKTISEYWIKNDQQIINFNFIDE